jgi:peroxiredoxin
MNCHLILRCGIVDEKNLKTEGKKYPKKKEFFKKEYSIIIVIIIIVVLIYILISPMFKNLVGQRAPDFTLTGVEGEKFTLSDNFGKVIVLDIMTTTCPACKSEMKHLRGIYLRYSPEDVMIITIDIDKGDSNGDLLAFKSSYGHNWTFARDTNNVANKYKVNYIPTMVLIDRKGIIRYHEAGELSERRLSENIDKLL